jgi:hypothetical protein
MHEYSWLKRVAPVQVRMNEYTGLHPVLGYCAPSGLGGLIWIWGIEPGMHECADGRTEFDNARETCANTP